MMLEWLAYIWRKNVAVQQEVCVIISGVKLMLAAWVHRKPGYLSKERKTIATALKEYTLQER